jgi:hypothetical protein
MEHKNIFDLIFELNKLQEEEKKENLDRKNRIKELKIEILKKQGHYEIAKQYLSII